MKPERGLAERYGLALILLVVSLTYSIAVPEGEWLRIVGLLLQITALYATLAAAEVDRRILRAFLVVFVGAFLIALGQAGFADDDSAAFVRACVLVVLLGSLPLVGLGVIRQVRGDRKISVQTMMGVLCAYLLLMSVFAYSYAVLGELGSVPFFNEGEQWNRIGDYIYYSLITITTVGMGDLTPATDLGRSLTAAEALIGQIYMVTVVAVIVSNLGRKDPRAEDSGKDLKDREGPYGG